MSDKFFLDTNIIVYSFDDSEPTKQNTARNLIRNALLNHNGCISYQVIQEFFNVATRKFKIPLSTQDSHLYLNNVLSPLCGIFPTVDFYSQALLVVQKLKYSFYDSLIISAAQQAKCATLFTEDMHHGQVIDNLTLINPFL
ncbi:PIN domain-containing protein [Desulfobacterales bacterium HSG17]|nr:PIN domain-containing protein [Desulfobacterales bacterium HSG17]